MRVLVANRGEIACRILRTLRVMGVPSVSVFTPADAHAPHVWLSDCAIALSDAQGYMNGAALIAAAQKAQASAIHPGYGFLSQSPEFAEAIHAAGLTFIGPSPRAMRTLGNKREARQVATSLGIDVVPGAEEIGDAQQAHAVAQRLGLPLLIKAAGGGGGRGMRLVSEAHKLEQTLSSAAREAKLYFGNDALLLERYIHPARHIEVQMLGDGRRAQVLGERECSLQRRYQKVLEEGPVTHLTPAQRQKLYGAATALCEALGYSGAGTVEFLLGPDGAVYFLEVNTRLQVEHPVTEMCTGLDIVALQVQVAHGAALKDLLPHGPSPRGHAIEVRLNAESPHGQFLPQTGTVSMLHWPTGPNVRVDAGVASQTIVGGDYDPLLAKIIAWGHDRACALATLRGAMDELVLLGVGHNQSFLSALLAADFVAQQQTFTTTVESLRWSEPEVPGYVTAAVGEQLHTLKQTYSKRPNRPGPWAFRDGFLPAVRP